MPGGPESNAALRGPPGAEMDLTSRRGSLNVPSQPLSHLLSLLTESAFPSISRLVAGAYLSAHRELSCDPLAEGWRRSNFEGATATDESAPARGSGAAVDFLA